MTIVKHFKEDANFLSRTKTYCHTFLQLSICAHVSRYLSLPLRQKLLDKDWKKMMLVKWETFQGSQLVASSSSYYKSGQTRLASVMMYAGVDENNLSDKKEAGYMYICVVKPSALSAFVEIHRLRSFRDQRLYESAKYSYLQETILELCFVQFRKDLNREELTVDRIDSAVDCSRL